MEDKAFVKALMRGKEKNLKVCTSVCVCKLHIIHVCMQCTV